MNIYSIEFKGKLIIEPVKGLPLWTIEDSGRILYENTTEKYWIGGINDWVPFNFLDKSIYLNHIRLLNDSVYISKYIPCYHDEVIFNVQDVISHYDNATNYLDVFGNFVNTKILESSSDSIYTLINNCNLTAEFTNLIQYGDLLISLDSTSSINISLSTYPNDGSCVFKRILNIDNYRNLHDVINLIEFNINSIELNPQLISTFDTTSNLESAILHLSNVGPYPISFESLYDFDHDLTTPGYLHSTKQLSFANIDSTSLLIGQCSIPHLHDNFQEFLNSCDLYLISCQPFVHFDFLIIDNDVEFQTISNYYSNNHTINDPNVIYNILTSKIYLFYNGIWSELPLPNSQYSFSNLLRNTIYFIPVTKSIFYLDCNNGYLKLLDKNR